MGFLLLTLLGLFPLQSPSSLQDWRVLESRHFTIIGQGDEKQMRAVGLKLEQFRTAIMPLLPSADPRLSWPTRVIVFPSQSEFARFQPGEHERASGVTGYFLGQEDGFILALSAGEKSAPADHVMFHEFTHVLISGQPFPFPTWLNEGMAEYFSTLDIRDRGAQVLVGRLIADHRRVLRESELIPLAQLLAATQESELYREPGPKRLFYAQSWALVHFLRHRSTDCFRAFLRSIEAGQSVESSLRRAYGMDLAQLEQAFRLYLEAKQFPTTLEPLRGQMEESAPARIRVASEAEALAQLGDLLWRIGRSDEAELLLEQSLRLDRRTAPAHYALGLMNYRRQRFADAREHFRLALESGASTPPAYFYYASAIQWAETDESQFVSQFSDEVAATMRAALARARELAPNFPDTYRTLAFIDMVRQENLPEAVALLQEAIRLAPRRDEFRYTLAQVYLRQKNFSLARETAASIAGKSANPELRRRAAFLLESIGLAEEQARQSEAEKSPPPTGPGTRFQGEQVRGMLTRIDCGEKVMTLTVLSEGRIYRFKAAPGQIPFVRYTPEIPLEITCGALIPTRLVIVTYRRSAGDELDLLPVGVEFLKIDRSTPSSR